MLETPVWLNSYQYHHGCEFDVSQGCQLGLGLLPHINSFSVHLADQKQQCARILLLSQ